MWWHGLDRKLLAHIVKDVPGAKRGVVEVLGVEDGEQCGIK